MQAAIFDAYGTLLDVNSAVTPQAHRLDGKAEAFALLWRTKQLEYSWIRTLTGHHVDFGRVTDDALTFAAATHSVTDPALLSDLRDGYEHLVAFPDCAPALRAVGLPRMVLSNGTPAMLGRQLRHAGLADLFDDVLSAEAAGVFKPHPDVYRLATARLGVPPGEVAFLSSNPWDVFGAHGFGFRAIWVNRKGQPDEYGLRGTVAEIADLSGLPALLG